MIKTQTHSVLTNGKPLVLRFITNRTIEIDAVAARFEELDENGRLVALHFDNNYTIKPGDNVVIGKSTFRIQKLKKTKLGAPLGYHLLVHTSITTTANFIVPFLGISQWNIRFRRNFVNAFIGTEENGDYGKFIYLLYRPGEDEQMQFETWNTNLKKNKQYVDQSNPDKEQILIKFKIPKDAKTAVKLIMQGKYSQIMEKDKKTILDWHDVKKTNIIGQILYRAVELKEKREAELDCILPKDVELKSMFNKEQELFTKKLITC